METCNNMEKKLHLYADNEMSTQDKKVIEEHLSKCKDCSNKVNDIINLNALLADNSVSVTPSSNFVSNTLRIYHEGREKITIFNAILRNLLNNPLKVGTVWACTLLILILLGSNSLKRKIQYEYSNRQNLFEVSVEVFSDIPEKTLASAYLINYTGGH